MLLKVLIILALIFVLTYDPKSKTLEKIINPENYKAPCCQDEKYRADNPDQCETPYYHGLQFGDPEYKCPKKHPETILGAIIER